MTTTQTDVVRAPVAWPEVCRAVDDAGERFVHLVRRLPPEAGGLPVPGLDWSVAETVAHVLTVARRGSDPRRARTLAELAELNQTCVDEVGLRALPALADLLDEELSVGSARRQQLGGAEPFALHCGVVAEVPTAACYLLADFLVHGHDVATAVDQPWELPADHAALALHGVLPTMRAWVRPEVLAGPLQRAVVTLPPRRGALDLTVGGGRLVVTTTEAEAGDVVDPARALLAMAGRRARDADAGRFAGWFGPI